MIPPHLYSAKQMRLLPFSLIYLIPFAAAVSLYFGGPWLLIQPVLVFLLIPTLDFLLGQDQANPTSAKPFGRFRVLLLGFILVQYLLIFYGALVWKQTFSWQEGLGVAVAVGIATGGIGITVAHELVHSLNPMDKFLGQLLLASVWYGHFGVEHILGHHVHVGTPRDPATSRLNESIYRFYFRTIVGSFQSAWQLEGLRLARGQKNLFSWNNRILTSLLFSGFLLFIFQYFFGAGLFFILQSVVAFSLLEVINYVEHYGLTRKVLPEGNLEPVGFQHSWDSYYKLTNYFLVNLQRHSDHHKYPTRHFNELKTHPTESPQLPLGYPSMILLALVPPLWFKVMNPKVMKVNGCSK